MRATYLVSPLGEVTARHGAAPERAHLSEKCNKVSSQPEPRLQQRKHVRRNDAPSNNAPTLTMLSWDDFRYVKAIADTRSLGGAAQELVGQSFDRVPPPRADREAGSARACSSAAAAAMRSPPAARRWCGLPSAWARTSSRSSGRSPGTTCAPRANCASPPTIPR